MTDEQKTFKELLLSMYLDNMSSNRHHETQRSTVTSSIIAVDTIIIGISTFDQLINQADIPLLVLLILLSCFGAVFTIKHFERIQFHSERARQLRRELDEHFGSNRIIALKNIADEIHNNKFPLFSKIRHHNLWIIFHVIILLIGIVLLYIAIVYPQLK